MSLVVNLLGGAASRKSSTAAGIFALAKAKHMSCELVFEVAKDLIYDASFLKLECQPYVFARQLFNIERLFGVVDFIITDSPILLSIIYNKKYPASFNQAVLDIFNTHNNLNIFLERGPEFEKNGRIHNLQESIATDNQILELLVQHEIPFIKTPGGFDKLADILAVIKKRLKCQTSAG